MKFLWSRHGHFLNESRFEMTKMMIFDVFSQIPSTIKSVKSEILNQQNDDF